MQTQSPHCVRFGRLAPTISVTDMSRALDFYTNVLGFEKTFENGSPVGFVILRKDSAELHLSLNRNHKATVQNVAHLMVEDASELYAHCESSQVRIIKSLRDADFGLRCFVFADPDGNRVDVGQALTKSATKTKAAAVLYAKNLAKISEFYTQVCTLPVVQSASDYVVLESADYQLVILSIPVTIAAAITVATPPVRREGTPIKLVFFVENLGATRKLAADLGGQLNPAEREWSFQDWTVCDGHDPEGNVVQFREHKPG